ncbi:hypothetical protein CRUP_032374 [Coryphaenoides rupestris]|nr:hypothetical protein CRUP_032374 [Coryphaenoides rupestris]
MSSNHRTAASEQCRPTPRRCKGPGVSLVPPAGQDDGVRVERKKRRNATEARSRRAVCNGCPTAECGGSLAELADSGHCRDAPSILAAAAGQRERNAKSCICHICGAHLNRLHSCLYCVFFGCFTKKHIHEHAKNKRHNLGKSRPGPPRKDQQQAQAAHTHAK